MAACDNNALVELADGLLPPERAASVFEHVDTCQSCRAVLAGLARSETLTVARHAETRRAAATETTRQAATATTPTRLGAPAEAEVLPAQMLRQYLQRDAPQRERAIAVFWGTIAFISVVLFALAPTSPAFARAGLAIQLFFFLHEAAVWLALRRGWYSPRLPWALTMMEVTVFFAMLLAAALYLPARAVEASPGPVLLAVLVVFTAIRAEPLICLLAGSVAAAETIFIYFIAIAPDPAQPQEAAVGLLWRAGFFLVGGVAGALVAGHLVRRAEQALRDVREQDLHGKYLLHERLGTGGMGEVYRATYCPEGGFIRTVAVKRVREDLSREPRFEAFFRAEARLGAALAHPNLVQVLDCGKLRGSFMLAMEHVDGCSLARLTKNHGSLEPRLVAYLGAELAAALEYLHGRRGPDGAPLGLVHCDVNPPNVLCSRLGEVKLADFGVARAAGRGGFGGKPPYAAPEQLRGDELDGATDVFALGLTLHEALTGRRVFAPGESVADTAIRPPSATRADVPAALDALVMELVAFDTAERPTAAAVRARLRSLGGHLAPYPEGQDLLARAVR